jgi:hypothetical protein
MGVPEVTKPIGEWLRAGFVPVRGQKLSAAEQAQPASLLQPRASTARLPDHEELLRDQGIQFLRSLRAVRRPSRRPHDQPAAFATPWSASTQLRTTAVEAMQTHLTRIGLYKDKIDGKAGMQTRAALGAYQKSAGLKVDCWPSEGGAAIDDRGAVALILRHEKTRPRFRPGFKFERERSLSGIRLVADLVAAEAPAIAVPEALAHHAAGRIFVHIDRRRRGIGRAAGGDRAANDGAADQAGSHARGDAALRIEPASRSANRQRWRPRSWRQKSCSCPAPGEARSRRRG